MSLVQFIAACQAWVAAAMTYGDDVNVLLVLSGNSLL